MQQPFNFHVVYNCLHHIIRYACCFWPLKSISFSLWHWHFFEGISSRRLPTFCHLLSLTTLHFRTFWPQLPLFFLVSGRDILFPTKRSLALTLLFVAFWIHCLLSSLFYLLHSSGTWTCFLLLCLYFHLVFFELRVPVDDKIFSLFGINLRAPLLIFFVQSCCYEFQVIRFLS